MNKVVYIIDWQLTVKTQQNCISSNMRGTSPRFMIYKLRSVQNSGTCYPGQGWFVRILGWGRYAKAQVVACGAGMKRTVGMVERIYLKRLSRIQLQRCMVKLKEMKQGTKLNNKQQHSSQANITISASMTSSIRGLQMATATACQAISSVHEELG